MNKVEKIRELIDLLHKASVAYYEHNNPVMSDRKYDELYDELISLEKETGVIYSNSPTQRIGCEVKSVLQKVKHTHPMMSLDKTKSIKDLIDFSSKGDCILSLKMDGLTICLAYDDGKLIRAETRGDGSIGEDVTHNAKVFDNIPLTIDYKGYIEFEGEAIVCYDDFDKINQDLSENQKFKNARNLASGSVRQLDSNIASKRHLRFIVWKLPGATDFMSDSLEMAEQLGFDVVPYTCIPINYGSEHHIKADIDLLKGIARAMQYPIDGLVMTYNDIKFGRNLGSTVHHPKHSIAFKFYDEEELTTLKNVEWSIGKTGQLTPVAVFNPVEIDGTTVSRASLHNLTIIKNLELGIGDEITVYKANQIIPQIRENITRSNNLIIPSKCPVCGYDTKIQKDNDSEVLICNNPSCQTKLIKRLSHFVSRKCMNIDGLSEETLTKMVKWGWIKNLSDIYCLDNYFEELSKKEGFGIKSVNKLKQSIENSKHVTLDCFISSISIPGIGTSQAKVIASYYETWDNFSEAGLGRYRFDMIDGIGEVLNTNIHKWFRTMYYEDGISNLVTQLHFVDSHMTENQNLKGINFVITGSLGHFENRDALKKELEARGAKVSESISKKTNYLINNNCNSNSSKNQKAKALNIPIINEDQVISMIDIRI